jgi:hypothetical protein
VCLQKEVYEERCWYNANRRAKVRELATQTTAYYDDVQLASNNVYSNLYPPSPDKELSIKVIFWGLKAVLRIREPVLF